MRAVLVVAVVAAPGEEQRYEGSCRMTSSMMIVGRVMILAHHHAWCDRYRSWFAVMVGLPGLLLLLLETRIACCYD